MTVQEVEGKKPTTDPVNSFPSLADIRKKRAAGQALPASSIAPQTDDEAKLHEQWKAKPFMGKESKWKAHSKTGWLEMGAGIQSFLGEIASASGYVSETPGSPNIIGPENALIASEVLKGKAKDTLKKRNEIYTEDGLASLGAWMPMILGMSASAASSLVTGGASLSAIPALIGEGTMAAFVTSTYGNSILETELYDEKTGHETSEFQKQAVGIGSGVIMAIAGKIAGSGIKGLNSAIGSAASTIMREHPQVATNLLRRYLADTPGAAQKFLNLAGKTGKEALKTGGAFGVMTVTQEVLANLNKYPEDKIALENIVADGLKSFRDGAFLGMFLGGVAAGQSEAYNYMRRKKAGVTIVQDKDGKVYEKIGDHQTDPTKVTVMDSKLNFKDIRREDISDQISMTAPEREKILDAWKTNQEALPEIEKEIYTNNARRTLTDLTKRVAELHPKTGMPISVNMMKDKDGDGYFRGVTKLLPDGWYAKMSKIDRNPADGSITVNDKMVKIADKEGTLVNGWTIDKTLNPEEFTEMGVDAYRAKKGWIPGIPGEEPLVDKKTGAPLDPVERQKAQDLANKTTKIGDEIKYQGRTWDVQEIGFDGTIKVTEVKENGEPGEWIEIPPDKISDINPKKFEEPAEEKVKVEGKEVRKDDVPVYEKDGQQVSKGYIRGAIRTAKTPTDLNGLRFENDPELDKMYKAKFPEMVQTYSIGKDEVERDEVLGAINHASDPKDLKDIKINLDPEMQGKLDAKLASLQPVENIEPKGSQKAAPAAEGTTAAPAVAEKKPEEKAEEFKLGTETFKSKEELTSWLDKNYNEKDRFTSVNEEGYMEPNTMKVFNEWYKGNKDRLAKEDMARIDQETAEKKEPEKKITPVKEETAPIVAGNRFMPVDKYLESKVSDINNEWGEQSFQIEEAQKEIDKKIGPLKLQVKQIKGRKAPDIAKKKELNAEIEQLQKEKNKLKNDVEDESLQRNEEFRNWMIAEVGKRGIKYDEGSDYDFLDEVLMDIYERPGIEHTWDMTAKQVFENTFNYWKENNRFTSQKVEGEKPPVEKPITSKDEQGSIEKQVSAVSPEKGTGEENTIQGGAPAGLGGTQEQGKEELTGIYKIVRDRFAKDLADNYELRKAKYLNDNGNVISGDLAKNLSPDYRNQKMIFSQAVHGPASDFAKKLFDEMVQITPPDEGSNFVLMTAGGTGAGKTKALEFKLEKDNPPFLIYDSNMANYDSSVGRIEKALETGKEVDILFVWRDPFTAYVKGVIPRMRDERRSVGIDTHIKTTVNSLANIQKLYDLYKDNENVDFEFWDNDIKESVNPEDIFSKSIDQIELKRRLQDEVNSLQQKGKLTEAETSTLLEKAPAGDEGTVPETGSGDRSQEQVTQQPTLPAEEIVSTSKPEFVGQTIKYTPFDNWESNLMASRDYARHLFSKEELANFTASAWADTASIVKVIKEKLSQVEAKPKTIRKGAKKKIRFKPDSPTGIAVNKVPNDFAEAVLQFFAGWGRLRTKDFINETDYQPRKPFTKGQIELDKYYQLLAKNGVSLDGFYENLPNAFQFKSGGQQMKDEIISLMKSYPNRGLILTELLRRQGEPIQGIPTEEDLLNDVESETIEDIEGINNDAEEDFWQIAGTDQETLSIFTHGGFIKEGRIDWEGLKNKIETEPEFFMQSTFGLTEEEFQNLKTLFNDTEQQKQFETGIQGSILPDGLGEGDNLRTGIDQGKEGAAEEIGTDQGGGRPAAEGITPRAETPIINSDQAIQKAKDIVTEISNLEKPEVLLSELTLPKEVFGFFNSLKKSDASRDTWAVFGKGFSPYGGSKISSFFTRVNSAVNGAYGHNQTTDQQILKDQGFDISLVDKADHNRIWFKNGTFLTITTGSNVSNANFFYAGTQVSLRDVPYVEIMKMVQAGELTEDKANEIIEQKPAEKPEFAGGLFEKPIVAEKELWQMTQKEYLDNIEKPKTPESFAYGRINHEELVKQALSEDKVVPTEVLADYPHLKSEVPVEKTYPLDSEGNDLADLDDNPVELNPDGTITVYHRTNFNPEQIKVEGFKTLENTDEVFASTKKEGQAVSYGDIVIELKVKPEDVRIDDAFHDREIHVAIKSSIADKAFKVEPKPPEPVLQESNPIPDIQKLPEEEKLDEPTIEREVESLDDKEDAPADKPMTDNEAKQEKLEFDEADKLIEQVGPIKDFGEKIGGARKDDAESGFTMGKRGEKKDKVPAWMSGFKLLDEPEGKYRPIKAHGHFIIWRSKEVFDSQEEALQRIKLVVITSKFKIGHEPGKDVMTWQVYRKVTQHKRYPLKGGFETEQDAMKWMLEHQEYLLNYKPTFPIRPHIEKLERTGKSVRQGSVTTQQFRDKFGFSGGEFGNWVPQDERQRILDMAWDGLSDLADVLGIPPKALSLNGQLSIAFGARGQGLKGASAHYERGRAVFNLTRMKGAGGVAHEWLHALDHYLGRNTEGLPQEKKPGELYEKPGMMLSETVSYRMKGTRAELKEAFNNLLEGIFKQPKIIEVSLEHYAKQITRWNENLDYELKQARGWLVRGRDYGRIKKPGATEAQLQKWDDLVAKIKSGDYGADVEYATKEKGWKGAGVTRKTFQNIITLDEIAKSILGRSMLTKDNYLTKVGSYLGFIKGGQSQLEKYKIDNKEERNTPTRFFYDAKDLDNLRVSDYWTTQPEMLARAFEAFVEDQINKRGDVSQYLVHSTDNENYKDPLFGDQRPYPDGTERETFNQLFQKFFDTVLTKEEGENVAIFKRRPVTSTNEQTIIDEIEAKENEVERLIRAKENFPKEIAKRKKEEFLEKTHVQGDMFAGENLGRMITKQGEAFDIRLDISDENVQRVNDNFDKDIAKAKVNIEELNKLLSSERRKDGTQGALFKREPIKDNANFKKWFGNSKIVDSEGNPKIMYHGTRGDFDTFRGYLSGSMINNGTIFLTHDVNVAEEFAGEAFKRSGGEYGGRSIMPVYVRAENPFDFENTDHIERLIEEISKQEQVPDLTDEYKNSLRKGDWLNIEPQRTRIESMGYDAFYVMENGVKNLAVFSSNQVKSATGNTGEFSTVKDEVIYKKGTEFAGEQLTVMREHEMIRRATAMSEYTGVDVEVVSTKPDLPKHIKADAIRQFGPLNESIIPSVYDRANKKVYIVAGDNKSVSDMVSNMSHEIWAHHGLVALLGKEPYLNVLHLTYRGMSPVDIANKAAQYKVPISDWKTIGEEYIGDMAGDGKINPTLWQRVIAKIREWIRKLFNISMSKAEIIVLLNKSKKNLIKNRPNKEDFLNKPAGEYLDAMVAWSAKPGTVEIKTGGYGLHVSESRVIEEAIAKGNQDYTTYFGVAKSIIGDKPAGWIEQALVKNDFDYNKSLDYLESKMDKHYPDKLYDIIKIGRKYLSENEPKDPEGLYKVLVGKGKTPDELNFLTWEKSVDLNNQENIMNQLDVEGKYDITFGNAFQSGESLYNKVVSLYGSEREASLFMDRAGVNGMRFANKTPTEFGTATSDGYVIYDNTPVDILNQIAFKRIKKSAFVGEHLARAGEVYTDQAMTKRNWKETVQGIIEAQQDMDLPVRKFEEEVIKRGGLQPNDAKPYRDISLARGKQETLYKDFTKTKMEPVQETIVKIIKNVGMPGENILPYAISKHAIERNRVFRARELDEFIENKIVDPVAQQDEIDEFRDSIADKDYAGVMAFDADKDSKPLGNFTNPDELAQTIIDEFEAVVPSNLIDELWSNIRNASTATLDYWVAGQQISPEQKQEYLNDFKYFVPLRGWRFGAAKELTYNRGEGFKASLQHAEGRKSLADNPLAYMQSVAFKAIGEQVDNEVKTAMLKLLMRNLQSADLYDLATVKKLYYTREVDSDGTVEWKPTLDRPDQALFDSGDAKTKIFSEHERLRTPTAADEHKVIVRRQGGDVVMIFKDKMLSVAHALNKQNYMYREIFTGKVKDARMITQAFPLAPMKAMNNYMKATMTSWNVVFPFTNFLRDAQEAGLTQLIRGEHGERVIANYQRSFPTVIRYVLGKPDLNNPDDVITRNFYFSGGPTGYTHLKSPEELEKEFDKKINRMMSRGTVRGEIKNAGHEVAEAISMWNQVFEDATRVSVYMTCLDLGMTNEDSIYAARQATIDFPRKGKLTSAYDAVQAFWGVAINSLQKNFKNWKDFPKAFSAVVAAIAALGYLISLINTLTDDEDPENDYKNISPWMRENYLLIPNLPRIISGKSKGNKYFSIPLPQFFRGFYSVGALTYQLQKGQITVKEAISKGMLNFASGLLPYDLGGAVRSGEFHPLAPFVPTVVKPFYEIAINRNYMGYTIAKEPFTRAQEKLLANARLGKDNVNPTAKFFTDLLFRWAHGDNATKYYMSTDVAKGVNTSTGPLTVPKGVEKEVWTEKLPKFITNPSFVEHLFKGYTGGTGAVFSDLITTVSQVVSPDQEINFKNVPFVNRFIRQTPEAKWAIIGEYYALSQGVTIHKALKREATKKAEAGQGSAQIEALEGSGYYETYQSILDSYDAEISDMSEQYDFSDTEGNKPMWDLMQQCIADIKALKEQYKMK